MSVIVIFSGGCGRLLAKDASDHIFTMGTVFEVRAIGRKAEASIREAESALYACESDISWRKEGSVPALFNEDGRADASRISGLMEMTLQVSRDSNGALDPTVLPLSKLWQFDSFGEADFDPDQVVVPEAEAISNALESVDWERLVYDPESHLLTCEDPSVTMELGAVGKGYAIDCALASMKSQGLVGGMINAGSSIAVFGSKQDGSAFNVALRDPRGSLEDYIGVLHVSDLCISTSGDYERYFIRDGVRYHHILDPRTGRPADSGLMQVTILSEDCALGDALSTACFVLGLDEGMALARQYGVSAIFVDTERQVWLSDPSVSELLDFSGEDKGYIIMGL